MNQTNSSSSSSSSMNVTNAGGKVVVVQHSDNPEEEMNKVILALQAVFGGGGGMSSSREEADRYLTSFQRHVVAWMVCDQLLWKPNLLPYYGPFFAAQTLHAKCRVDVHSQLPPDSWSSLRDSLLQHLVTYTSNNTTTTTTTTTTNSNNNTAIVTRLCMSMAALSVQMGWITIIPDLLQRFQQQQLPPTSNNNNNNSDNNNLVLLQLLQLIPEESTSDRLILLDESKRQVYLDTLQQASSTILNWLWQNQSMTTASRKGVLQCLHSWIRYVDIPANLLEQSPLLPWVFQLLPMEECAVDVVVELLRMYPSNDDNNSSSNNNNNNNNSSSSKGNMGLVHKVIPLAMSLEGAFRTSLEKEDEDGMRAYCRIFVEMGESYMSLIMSPEELQQFKLVDLVLLCSTIPDKDIAHMTLHFWYRFVCWLESLEPYDYRQYQIDRYTPQLLKLVPICTDLMKYPSDLFDTTMDAEEDDDPRLDDIQKQRYYVADTLEDSCRLLGGDSVLNQVGERLQTECQIANHTGAASTSWQGIESCLFAIRSISLYVPSDEKTVLPFVMKLIPQLPSHIIPLRTTAHTIIGKYALWLNQQPDHLTSILPFLAEGLSSPPPCASAAAIAMKELCENCNYYASLGDSVLQLYDAIPSLHLQLRDELEVLEGACKAISRQLSDLRAFGHNTTTTTNNNNNNNDTTITNYVHKIVNPIGARLVQLADPNNPHSTAKLAVMEIERLTVVARFLHVPRIATTVDGNTTTTNNNNHNHSPKLSARSTFLLDLMNQVWPLLDTLSSKRFPKDVNLAEKLCRLHKHVLRGCGSTAYQPMLEPLCTHLILNYSQSFLSPYLYAASICITEYGRNPQFTSLLFDKLLTDMSRVTFQLLKSIDDFIAHPDVVEEFFFLAGRMMTYCPHPLVLSPLLHSILQCAIVAMTLDHKDANRGTLNFLENFVSYGSSHNNPSNLNHTPFREAMERIMMAEGQALTNNLIQALMGNLPAYRIDNSNGSIASILYYLHQWCSAIITPWIHTLLTSANTPEPISKPLLMAFHTNNNTTTTLNNNTSRRSAKDEFYSSVRKFYKDCDRSRKLNI